MGYLQHCGLFVFLAPTVALPSGAGNPQIAGRCPLLYIINV